MWLVEVGLKVWTSFFVSFLGVGVPKRRVSGDLVDWRPPSKRLGGSGSTPRSRVSS